MKAAKNNCENNKDDQDSSYLSKEKLANVMEMLNEELNEGSLMIALIVRTWKDELYLLKKS